MSLKRTWQYATLGVVLSCYALYVEHKISHKTDEPTEEEFQALCDIESIGASCSSAFSLPEGKMVSYFGFVPEGHWLDVPNPLIGLVYYLYWLLFMPSFPKELTAGISSLAMAASFFLGYKLTVLKELCLLCWTTHVINVRLLWSAYAAMASKPKGPAKIKRV